MGVVTDTGRQGTPDETLRLGQAHWVVWAPMDIDDPVEIRMCDNCLSPGALARILRGVVEGLEQEQELRDIINNGKAPE